MKAVEIMTTGVVSVPPEASVKEAANLDVGTRRKRAASNR